MDFFNNHRKLFVTATIFFVVLTIFVAILPALHNQQINAPLPSAKALSPDAIKGKAVYVANGCVACHTQQVRNIEMDNVWGQRPSLAADYAAIGRTDFWRNTATLMGTERTGPDLTDIGTRQPSKEWNLVHLYNPRIVVEQSIMAPYPWLFDLKGTPEEGDVVVSIPEEFAPRDGRQVIASKDALYLIAYLQELKQAPLSENVAPPDFLYKREAVSDKSTATATPSKSDGQALYVAHCQSCHQANGEGLPGAFPPLKGSKIVQEEDLEKYIDIIMNGYDSRPEYSVMAAVGINADFTADDVAAIINFERTSWGNKAKEVTAEEIKKIVDFVKLKAK
ncbi:cbb3-type cytochrome c oxidase subunit II [Sphingobacterium faecium]|uniref:cbb3-type cytochrome c oxidase subunit II n=1 Tax=Sphingobacterium faecium TaxID=34087 RepID=UPI0024689109|nr:cbb3-type cytochrome c oxidase subunit II [Sphingobacterium faecium]MDH5828786.1 cbb3-type cytochrome c oxidase subunit II [Sphingobacterium faecium]